jgi:hypothetical protein
MTNERFFLLVSAWIAAGMTTATWAQPVLTGSDLPQGGQTYLRANAIPPVFADLDANGEALTWDFSNLVSTGETSTEYLPISSASITTQIVFGSADHFTAFDFPELGLEEALPISGATTYLEIGGSSYRVIGLGLTTDIFDLPVIYEDEEELLPLPLTFGASLEGSSALTIDLPELLYYDTEQTSLIEVDAWGTLLLPGNAYECLRVKRTYSALDSVNVALADIGFSLPREGTVYEWYAAGEGMPVLSVQSIAGIPAVWQYKPTDSDPTTVAEASRRDALPLLNPATVGHAIALSTPHEGPVHWCVTDAQGRPVFDGILNSAASRTVFPSQNWPAGAYSLRSEDYAPVRIIIQ